MLVLRSRIAGEAVRPPGRAGTALTGTLLGRLGPELAAAFRTRVERELADEALLAEHDADPAREPAILSIRPAAGSPVPGRLERDVAIVRGGLEAGRAAARAALAI